MTDTDAPTRRALRHCGKHVYAPWCDACDSDRENSYATGRLDEGWCDRCHRVLHLDARDQYAALELVAEKFPRTWALFAEGRAK